MCCCIHIAGISYIENSRFTSFDIKLTTQGFENACWHREACRAIQHAFSKPSLVNLISKYTNLVFYLSVTLQTSDYDVIFVFCLLLIQRHRHHSKSATSSWPDNGTCSEIDNVYQPTCTNAFNMQGNWYISLYAGCTSFGGISTSK